MDLGDAVNCIQQYKKTNSSEEYHIGIVSKDIPSLAGYKEGEVVVYRIRDPSKASERERLSWTRDESGDPVTVIVERPYSSEKIDKRALEGPCIFSHGSTVCVPIDYVEEVKGL